jgi:hypothetical protein
MEQPSTQARDADKKAAYAAELKAQIEEDSKRKEQERNERLGIHAGGKLAGSLSFLPSKWPAAGGYIYTCTHVSWA